MAWIRKIAEYILVLPTMFPYLLKLSLLIGLPAFAILFFGFAPGGDSPEAYNITLSVEKKVLFGGVFFVCSLPWLAIMSIHLIDYVEKSKKRDDPNFINLTKQKFKLGKELDHQEMELLAEDIQSRIKLNEKISVQEDAFYILQDENNIEKFLYESDNERFSQVLHYFSLHLNDTEFINFIRYIKSEIPSRLQNLIRKRVLTDITIRRIHSLL